VLAVVEVDTFVVRVLGRIPQLDPNRSRDVHTDDVEVRASPIARSVAPYQPLRPKPKVELPPLQVTVSFFAGYIKSLRRLTERA